MFSASTKNRDAILLLWLLTLLLCCQTSTSFSNIGGARRREATTLSGNGRRGSILTSASTAAAASHENQPTVKEEIPAAAAATLDATLSSSSSSSVLVLVDVENVRGTSNFQQSHDWFLARAVAHKRPHENQSLVLVVDHGANAPSLHTGGPLGKDVGVILSGPHQKADHVLIDLVRQQQQQQQQHNDDSVSYNETNKMSPPSSSSSCVVNNIVLVSSDKEVVMECQKLSSSTSTTLSIVDSVTYLDQLKSSTGVAPLWDEVALDQHTAQETNEYNAKQLLQKEMAERQELQAIDRMLKPRRRSNGTKKNMSRKKRTKLAVRRERVKARLAHTLALSLRHNTPNMRTLVEAGNTTELEDMVQAMQSPSHQRKIRRGTTSETTYERQLLAERLRRRMTTAGAQTTIWENDADVGNNRSLRHLLNLLHNSHNINGHPYPMELPQRNSAAAAPPAQPFGLPRRGGQRYFNPDVSATKSAASSIPGEELSLQIIRVPRNRPCDQHEASEDSATAKKTRYAPIRMIVMSDTHGYEDQLEAFVQSTVGADKDEDVKRRFPRLPDADILIHCGDFWDRKKKTLDAFFAEQDHIGTKIVVRGNHDPRMPSGVLFPKSKALYVTKPTTMQLEFGGSGDKDDTEDGMLLLALRPHSRAQTEVLLPPKCDVLVTHVPPYGLLDYTYHDQRAGSQALRRCVESSVTKPALWLCGHIHEGRGASYHTFHTKNIRPGANVEPTFVVNAAAANAGKANRLVNGPIVIDLVDPQDTDNDNDTTTTTTRTTTNNNRRSTTTTTRKLLRPDSLEGLVAGGFLDNQLQNQQQKDDDHHRRLMAVDLGLKSGIAVYDENGQILHVENVRFIDPTQLEEGLQRLIEPWQVSHVVIEGEDRKLYNIWKKTIERMFGGGRNEEDEEEEEEEEEDDMQPSVLVSRVIAEDWRRLLLTSKERRSARLAKQAASLIARQIVKKSPRLQDIGMTTDAAEAVLIGHYAVRVLGWANNDSPAVLRYTNGEIMR